MLGVLGKVIIGIIGVGSAGAAAYAVYKLVTKETVKDEVSKTLETDNPEAFEKMFSAVVKEKSDNNEVITVDVLDQWDEPLTEVEISGDEISTDIHVGDKIMLRDAF